MTMDLARLDLSFDSVQAELAASVDAFCARYCTPTVERDGGMPPTELWRGLAKLGVFGLGTDEVGGGALEIAAAFGALGRHACPGPLVTTITAAHLLPSGARECVIDGSIVAAVGDPELMPWGGIADVFVVLDGNYAHVASARTREPVETLAGEPWARIDAERLDDLGDAGPALIRASVAIATYLVGAGEHLLEVACQHARDRHQFGRPIGDFQAVAHPLADASTRLSAASAMTRLAAYAVDGDAPDADLGAAEARLSATAASLDAFYAAHQALGALAFTMEGPVGHVGRRIRQLSLLPPDLPSVRATVSAAWTP